MPVVEPVNAHRRQRTLVVVRNRVSARGSRSSRLTSRWPTAAVGYGKHSPNPRLEKIFLPDRWETDGGKPRLRQQDGRIQFARWVVDRVTGPSDRPVKVVMMFHFKVLAPPGQPSKGSTGTKVLYEEVLTGQR